MSGASYEVGSAFIQIVPSFDGAVTAIAGQAAEWGQQAGEIFAETFKGVVNSALKDMDAVKIDADTSEAVAKAQALRAEIGNLDAMVDLGIDETDTQEKIAALQTELAALEAEHPEIRVGIDTGEAEAGLAGLTAESGAADDALKGLGGDSSGVGPALSAAGGDAAVFSGDVNVLVAGIVALGAALLPIGGLALGAFAAIPALLSGAIAGVGALYAGLEPIITTLEAFSSSKTPTASTGSSGSSAASTALSNATAERDAAYSVQQAQESLTNAEVSGAAAVTAAQQAAAAATQEADQKIIEANQNLVQAEQAVTEAQENEQEAQEAVIAARQQAADQLQDYTDQLADNAISQQQDQLNLQEAQQALQEAMQPGSTATLFQQEQAQINVEQAQQALKDLGDQNAQLEQQATAAFAAGVNGAQSVIDAENQLQQAVDQVNNAVIAQQAAQTAVATASANAAKQVTINQENIAQAQQKNAQGVADAERALEQALANQKDAFERAALPIASASGAVNTYKSDFDKLTPAGQNFVTFVEDTLIPAFNGISGVAQNGLLPGLEQGLEDAMPFFQSLSIFVGLAAKGIGDLSQDLGKFAGSSSGLTQLQEMFDNGNTFMGDLGQAAEIFLQAFVGVGAQSAPIITALGNGIVNIAKAFDNWVNDGGFQGFLTWLDENGPRLADDLGEFLVGFGKLAVALTPLGVYLDDLVGAFSSLVGWVSENWARFGLLATAIGAVAIAILAIVGGPITLLIAAIALVVTGILTLANHWQEIWANIKQWSKDAWDYVNTELFQPIANFFSNTVPHAFDDFVDFCKALPGRALGALGNFAEEVWSGLIIGGTWLDTNVWEPIGDFFKGLPDRIGTVAEHMWDGIEAAFVTMLNALIDVWNDLHFKLPSFSVGPISFGGETIGMPPIPQIPVPSYHTGGVVQGTPGVEQLALLMPGEVVTPKSAIGALTPGNGSGITLNLELHVGDMTNVATVQKVVVDAFGQFANELQAKRAA